MRTALILSTLSLLLTSTASAQDTYSDPPPASRSGGRLGVGMYATLTPPNLGTGIGGASVVYDAGAFRVAGNLSAFVHDSGDDGFGIAARFLLPVHQMSRADFSLGVGAGLAHVFNSPGEDQTYVIVEGVGQIRVFLVENVALHGDLGIAFAAGEGNLLFGLGGGFFGSFGLTYFF